MHESGILRIKDILKSKGMSLDDFATKADISYNYAGLVSRNEAFPRKDKLIQIASALDVDIRDLFNPTFSADSDGHREETVYIKKENGSYMPIGKHAHPAYDSNGIPYYQLFSMTLDRFHIAEWIISSLRERVKLTEDEKAKIDEYDNMKMSP